VLESLKSYIGQGEPNAEYAQLGYAISNYTRNAILVEKYLRQRAAGRELQLASVRSEVALSAGLDLGKRQLAASVGDLRDQASSPPPGGVVRAGNTERELASTTSSTPCRVLGRVPVGPSAGLHRRLPTDGLSNV